jgi:hypothetical protein
MSLLVNVASLEVRSASPRCAIFMPPALGDLVPRMRYSLMSVIATPWRQAGLVPAWRDAASNRPTLVGFKPVDRNIRLRAAIPLHIPPRFSY